MDSWPSSSPTGEQDLEIAVTGWRKWHRLIVCARLGIELAKVMVLQYSNNESSISIGESVRDEDGTPAYITEQRRRMDAEYR